MVKLLYLYNFIVTALFAAAGLVSAKAFNQTIFALLFIPVALYFFRLLFRRGLKNIVSSATDIIPTTYIPSNLTDVSANGELVQGEELSNLEVRDLNRRLFLKLIGTAGITTFLFAIFTKSSHAAFFGSMPGPGTISLKDTAGNKIDPAEKQPTDGYEISELDDAQVPAYYGFVNKDGAWYIAKEGSGGDYRYTRGSNNFATGWSNRVSATYDYFNNVF